jgi:hypothetical protein
MNFFYCWHRPGRAVRQVRTCRHCGVAIWPCCCLSYERTPSSDCSACEGSGWAGIIRSKAAAVAEMLREEVSVARM